MRTQQKYKAVWKRGINKLVNKMKSTYTSLLS